MDRKSFRKVLEESILILDGASGTQMQKRGMPNGVCPEQWAIENPEALISLQREYVEAGSQVVYTFTFGGNRKKLAEFGLEHKTKEINRELALLSRRAVGTSAYVAGDIAPTGHFAKPLGDMEFEEMVDVFKEQAVGLLEGGVDFFIIETMMDIQEARAALLAVKEICELPVCVSMTFNEDGRSLTGTDPVTALITLQSMGADAVGCNCSTGPIEMLEIIKKMKAYAKIPIIAKPNAGLPKLVNGCTVFDMDAKTFGSYGQQFIDAGVNLLGGCCGTSPEYIQAITRETLHLRPVKLQPVETGVLTSARKTVFMGPEKPMVIVGERINPTGKKKLQQELREDSTVEVRRLALEQVEKGAEVLDVNVGMPGIDEKSVMMKMVEMLSQLSDAPLCLDSSSPEVLEAALRIYPGRALINSISAESAKLDKLLPVAAKYGAMFILLPLGDGGVPETAAERCKIIREVFEEASKYGYTKNDIVIDGLVMTVSSDQKAAMETLEVIRWSSGEFGCNTIIGLSNVSFGLPERNWVNSAFLAMAAANGLSMVIANPSSELLVNLKMACDVLTLRDKNSRRYIDSFSAASGSTPIKRVSEVQKTPAQCIYDAVLKGDREGILGWIDKALEEGSEPAKLVDDSLIPAINQVGQLFDRKEYYLPQLIQSAEAMKTAFGRLQPMLEKGAEQQDKKKIRIVLATVKGDIHDIGKNIVALMLRNYGFEVYDLGKDVPAEQIISKIRETDAPIVGLSALMTTTMVEMKHVIALAKKEGVQCKFMIGGAVVDQKYADEIGADGYSPDAYSAVKLAFKLAGEE